jgi:hypothetical protein
MANAIKYTLGTASNTIKIQNFAVGVNKGGYGPTSITNFYNGKTSNVGGYTVYVTNGGSGSPSIFIAGNDSSLITLSNQLGGTGITTIEGALNFFNASTTMLCTNIDYPSIVTSGLVLNLDATYTPSYPKNGSLWKDLSSFGNNATLVNGPSFSSADGGSIGFDGNDDYVSTPIQYLDRPCTFSIWINLSSLSSFQTFFGQDTSEAITRGRFYFQKTGITGEGLIQNIVNFSIVLSNGSIVSVNAINPIQTNVWYNYSAVLTTTTISLYENGILQNTVSDSNVFLTPNTTITLNAGYFNNTVVDFTSGKSSSFLIYNRALSAQEVLQNYNAGLQRFIPTDGMKLYLDGDNTDKQVATASIAYDISGNSNSGALNNGVALVSDGQRAFSFDGTNDFITTSATPSSLGMISGSFSVNAWIKNPISQFNPILSSYSNVSPGGQYTFTINSDYNGGGYLQVSFHNSIFTETGNTVVITPTNVWNMVTHTYDFTTKISKIYHNGLLINAFLMSVNLNASGFIRLGTFKFNGTFDYYYSGYIGQNRVYNKELPEAEISKIFDGTKTRYNPILTANSIQKNLTTRVKLDSGLLDNSFLSLVIDGNRNPGLFNKASFALSANAYKEGKLYAGLPTNGNGDMTFVRGTSATTKNISQNVTDTPSNLTRYSEQFDDPSWTRTNATIIPNEIFAPNYTKTASKLVETATTGTHSVSQNLNFATLGGFIEKKYTVTFYAKAAERNFCAFSFGPAGGWGGAGNLGFIVNLTTRTIGNDNSGSFPFASDAGNGWVRISFTKNAPTSGELNLTSEIGVATDANTKNYAGNGTSGIYIWGFQLSPESSYAQYLKTTNRNNVPRLDYNTFKESYPNILIEPQRTNLKAFSGLIINTNTYGLINAVLNPNVTSSTTPGGDSHSIFILNSGANTGNNTDGFTFGTGITFSSSVQYTQSLFVKYSEQGANPKVFRIRDNVIGGTHDFILSGTGSAPSISGSLQGATIEQFSNNWYRVSWTFTATGTVPGNRSDFWTLKTNVTAAIGYGLYVWGAQLEQGAYVTSYIPTTSTALTRNADILSRNNIYTNGLITSSGGTWFIDQSSNESIKTSANMCTLFLTSIFTNSFIIQTNTTGTLSFRKYTNSISVINQVITNSNVLRRKLAITWNTSTGTIKIFLNGVLEHTFTSQTFSNYENLAFYDTNGNQVYIPFKLYSSLLFPTPLTDTECIDLTSADIYTLRISDCSSNDTIVYSLSSLYVPGILVYSDKALQFPFTSGVPLGESTVKYLINNGFVDSLEYGCYC